MKQKMENTIQVLKRVWTRLWGLKRFMASALELTLDLQFRTPRAYDF